MHAYGGTPVTTTEPLHALPLHCHKPCVRCTVVCCTVPLPAGVQFDADMSAQGETAAAAGCVMRYVGRVDMQAAAASVSVRQYAAGHPFAQLQGSENMVVFTTERYGPDTPLVVRGPGAGAAVTAAGVFSDLLQVMRYSAGACT